MTLAGRDHRSPTLRMTTYLAATAAAIFGSVALAHGQAIMYDVWRAMNDNPSEAELTTCWNAATSFTDTTAAVGHTVYYWVRASLSQQTESWPIGYGAPSSNASVRVRLTCPTQAAKNDPVPPPVFRMEVQIIWSNPVELEHQCTISLYEDDLAGDDALMVPWVVTIPPQSSYGPSEFTTVATRDLVIDVWDYAASPDTECAVYSKVEIGTDSERTSSLNIGELSPALPGPTLTSITGHGGGIDLVWLPAESNTVLGPVDSGVRPAAAPTGVSATDGLHTDKVVVTWNSVPGATHYAVYRHLFNDPGGAALARNWSPETAFEDATPPPGTHFFYWVKAATDAIGQAESDFSQSDEGWRGLDCNNNEVPDDQDIASGTSQDFNGNGIPDECELTGTCCDPVTGACTVTVQTACTGTWTQGGSCVPNPCPTANLIQNGSFEDGPGYYQEATTSLAAWIVFTGNVDYSYCGSCPCSWWLAAHGLASLDMNGNQRGGIRQTFTSIVGASYRVTFSMAGNWGQPTKHLRVRAAGQQQDFIFDSTGSSCAVMGWDDRNWTFSATDAATTLEFESLNASTPGAGPALDNVRVELVSMPQPLLGDLNCDWQVSAADSAPFVLALLDPVAYQAQYPGCSLASADMNCDGALNGLDVSPFVDCLLNGNCPPCPTGSCCHADGTCVVTTQAACSGIWHADWTTCAAAQCPQPTGSCCQPGGTCTVTLEADCTSSWTMFGSCLPNPCLPTDMVLIPAGEFMMGDTFGDEESVWERPAHSAYVDAFYMDICEVSKSRWDTVHTWACANGYVFAEGLGKAPNHPVVHVNWYDCVKWCNARSEQAGRTPCYYTDATLTVVYRSGALAPSVEWDADGFRLPTEAEWEKAARGGTPGHRFPWSDQDTIQHTRCNYYSLWEHEEPYYPYDTSLTEGFHPCWEGGEFPWTAPVGFFTGALQFKADWGWPGAPDNYQTANGANGYGLHDMAGNAWEWCNDWYDATYYQDYVDSGSPPNPRGPSSGASRVLRGNCWGRDYALEPRCSQRANENPDKRYNGNGFRSVINAE